MKGRRDGGVTATNSDRDRADPMRILLADDERNFGIVLKAELEDEGHTVDLVGDGVEAVLKFMDNRYDFLLFDIKMPHLNGIDALRIVRKINPGVPAITFSGHAGSDEMTESLRMGALRCLTKPFEVSRLKDEIKTYGQNSDAQQ
jgi:two-component system response regulator (stage 0 sporulation protein F)